jgi:hypothetical protein
MSRRRRAPHIKHKKGRPKYRKPSPWPDSDLKSREGLDTFLCTLIEKTWRMNPLDPRTVGAINNTTKILLESRGWIQKTPLQIIQTNVVKSEIDWKKVYQETPEGERLVVARFIKRLENGQGNLART